MFACFVVSETIICVHNDDDPVREESGERGVKRNKREFDVTCSERKFSARDRPASVEIPPRAINFRVMVECSHVGTLATSQDRWDDNTYSSARIEVSMPMVSKRQAGGRGET